MTLFVHRGRSTQVLADSLADLLAEPLSDPFDEEVVAAPAKGVERWLAQRLSHRLGTGSDEGAQDGVCAGVRFLTPHSLVSLILGVERDDPWHPDRLAWPVLRAVDAHLGEPWLTTLATHLGHGLADPVEREIRHGRRYAVARRLAGLFASYAAHRPALLADWREGGQGDGAGAEVPGDLAWQPVLWRHVLAEVDAEAPDERHARVLRGLQEGPPEDLALPGRLSLFGHTRIARSEAEVLGALGRHRDVHLWLPQASPAAWDRLVPEVTDGPVARRADTSGLVVRHPLVAGLGRDARELQRTLAPLGAAEVPVVTGGGTTEEGVAEATLLQRLQDDIAHDRVPGEATHEPLAEDDDSVQIHACHGRTRQIEVLRDVLADLLHRDPTLEPRDILVMCPDIEAFAPLVHAGFGLAEAADPERGHPAHGMRVRLADRAPVRVNPLLGVTATLLELAAGRVTAGQVLDLARSTPVRGRFRFSDDDLERLTDWTDQVSVRWGLDAEHRSRYGLVNLSQNTWASGLDRILVGAALDGRDRRGLGPVLGLDDLDSGDLDLAGRFRELLDRLGAAVRDLQEADGAATWLDVLRRTTLDLAEVDPREPWQATQFEHEIEQLRVLAARGERSVSLTLPDLQSLMAAQTAGRAGRANFRTGALTVCTMVPMRSVPHRVVALIGLDDGAYPRVATADGDDVLARDPRTGERDLRSEDRQLLLDAVMSASDTLVITYAGRDPHSGEEREPAVPLGELVDTLTRTVPGLDRDRLVTVHPLQAHDPRNLGASGEGDRPLLPGDRPFSHDRAALSGALALRRAEHGATGPLADVTLPPAPRQDVPLADLIAFLQHPARGFLRGRLGASLPRIPDEREDHIPVELDGLARWQIADRMLTALLAGEDPEAIVLDERRRGDLPPDALGAAALEQIKAQVQAVAEATWARIGVGGWGVPIEYTTLDVDVPLPDGRRITGTLDRMVRGHALEVTYSSLGPKHRVSTWVTGLVLAASGPTTGLSHTIGQARARGRKSPADLYHDRPAPERALEILADLVDLRDRGLRRVVPLPLRTGYTWATRYRPGRPEHLADVHAEKEWTGVGKAWEDAGEGADRAWAVVLGGEVSYAELAGTAGEDERWQTGVTTRLGQYAHRLWTPLLAAEHQDLLR